MAKQAKSLRQTLAPPAVSNAESSAIVRWVQEEFESLVHRLNLLSEVRLEAHTAVPERPRAGMIVYADGVLWNPGAGEGIYYYKSTGVWTLLG